MISATTVAMAVWRPVVRGNPFRCRHDNAYLVQPQPRQPRTLGGLEALPLLRKMVRVVEGDDVAMSVLLDEHRLITLCDSLDSVTVPYQSGDRRDGSAVRNTRQDREHQAAVGSDLRPAI